MNVTEVGWTATGEWMCPHAIAEDAPLRVVRAADLERCVEPFVDLTGVVDHGLGPLEQRGRWPVMMHDVKRNIESGSWMGGTPECIHQHEGCPVDECADIAECRGIMHRSAGNIVEAVLLGLRKALAEDGIEVQFRRRA